MQIIRIASISGRNDKDNSRAISVQNTDARLMHNSNNNANFQLPKAALMHEMHAHISIDCMQIL